MAKKNGSTLNSILNLAAVIAIIFAIIVWGLQLVNHYANWDFVSKIMGALSKIKDICLAFVAVVCALSYAGGLNKGGWKTAVYIFIAIFIVLAILGVIIL